MVIRLKYLVLAVIAITIPLLTISYNPVRVSADVEYTWSYNFTNVYNTSSIVYSFDDLTIGQTYRWDLYIVDPDSGNPTQSIGFRELTPTAVTATATFGGAAIGSPEGSILYPDNYVGPMAVVDSNGTILGRHFIAQLPTYINSPDSGWFDGSGNVALGEKQVIGPQNFQGFCANPAYAPINSDGWQHTFRPCSVATTQGDFAILHYQIPAGYVIGSTDRIQLFLIPDSTVLAEYWIDDLIDYQYESFNNFAVNSSFVVINTEGDILPFIDNPRGFAAFTSGNNPHLGLFDTGVYNYKRVNGGNISDGESTWIVTDDPSGNEWTLTANSSEVSEGGIQTLTARATTLNVWESYHGYQAVEDIISGFLDETVYAFATARNHTYTVANVAVNDVNPSWINRASSINSILATPQEMEFIVSAEYDIVDVISIEENITQVLDNTGLNTESGRAALLTMILFFGMLGVAAFSGLRANVFAYMIVWSGLGATFVIGGFGTLLINTVFIIMTIGMWLFAMIAAQGNTDESI